MIYEKALSRVGGRGDLPETTTTTTYAQKRLTQLDNVEAYISCI